MLITHSNQTLSLNSYFQDILTYQYPSHFIIVLKLFSKPPDHLCLGQALLSYWYTVVILGFPNSTFIMGSPFASFLYWISCFMDHIYSSFLVYSLIFIAHILLGFIKKDAQEVKFLRPQIFKNIFIPYANQIDILAEYRILGRK